MNEIMFCLEGSFTLTSHPFRKLIQLRGKAHWWLWGYCYHFFRVCATCLCRAYICSAFEEVYLELVFGLLGEEGTKDVEVSSVLAKQDAKQLHLFYGPHLWLLFHLDWLAAWDRVGIAAALDRPCLRFLLSVKMRTVNSMESMMVSMVWLEVCLLGTMHHRLMGCWLSMLNNILVNMNIGKLSSFWGRTPYLNR